MKEIKLKPVTMTRDEFLTQTRKAMGTRKDSPSADDVAKSVRILLT